MGAHHEEIKAALHEAHVEHTGVLQPLMDCEQCAMYAEWTEALIERAVEEEVRAGIEQWVTREAVTRVRSEMIVLEPRTLALVCPEGHELPVPDNWREIWGTDTVRCTVHDKVMVEEPR